jgi:acyl carrier protein
MDRNEIEAKVKEVFVEAFSIEESDMVPEATIFEDLAFDSLDMIDLVVELQNAFDVKIRDDASIREIRTVEDIYVYIEGVRDKKKG